MTEVNYHKLNSDYEVRQAEPSDVPRIAEIWLEGAATVFAASETDLSDIDSIHAQFIKLVSQQDDDFKFWLCCDRTGFITGWSTVQPFHTTPIKRLRNAYGFISTYMSRDKRSKGLGGQLLNFVVDYCNRYTQIRYIFGLQDRSNIASITIGDRTGFRDYGKLPEISGLPPFSIILYATPARVDSLQITPVDQETRLEPL